jgi:phosphohistidine phosphatase
MILLLMRHGEAEVAAATDPQRPLTPYGQAEVIETAACLNALGHRFEKVLVSPYLRARQTAMLMLEHLADCEEEISGHITPDSSPQEAATAIESAFSGEDCGLVVMHQPIISRLVYYLTGEQRGMGTASVAVIDAPIIERGACELLCVV